MQSFLYLASSGPIQYLVVIVIAIKALTNAKYSFTTCSTLLFSFEVG